MLLDPHDPQARAVLETARAWGVPPSTIAEARQLVTVFERDGAGRVVRSVTDSAWTADDRANALALTAYEAGLCPGCRAPLGETTDPAREGGYVTSELRCHRCTSVEQHEAVLAAQKRPSPRSLLLTAALRHPEPEEPST